MSESFKKRLSKKAKQVKECISENTYFYEYIPSCYDLSAFGRRSIRFDTDQIGKFTIKEIEDLGYTLDLIEASEHNHAKIECVFMDNDAVDLYPMSNKEEKAFDEKLKKMSNEEIKE